MTLTEAITDLVLNKRVTVVTAKQGASDITGTLKTVGDGFIDVQEKTAKSTILLLAQIVSIEEL